MQRVEALRQRAELNALLREFFAARSVLEVETPILSRAGNTDPNIESFRCEFSGPAAAGAGTRWLRTSPEYALKRLLAAGIGDCYELGRVFRNGEAGARHNPEFTLLEWYRVGYDHRRLMEEVAELVTAALRLVGRSARVVRSSYRDLFRASLQLDPLLADIDTLRAPLADFAIDADGLTRDDWLDLLLTHCIQPEFPNDQLLLLFDFPASQCALAKVRQDDPPVAERFEAFLGPVELANGYHELCAADEQARRFEHDNRRRRDRGLAELPIDRALIDALRKGLPACAGVALGVDRLLMCLFEQEDIRQVLALPFAAA